MFPIAIQALKSGEATLPFGSQSEMSYDVPEPYEFEEDYFDYYGDKDYLEEEIEGIDFN